MLKGSNYALFKTRAKAAAGLVQRFREAADDFNERWVKDTDNSTYSTETDPTTLHNTYAQFIVICDAVLDGIRKLP